MPERVHNSKLLSRAAVAALAFLALFSMRVAAASEPKERDFYAVLDDIVGDFEYDLKNGNVTGLKDLSIRNIGVGENVPPSFKTHLELMLTEKILKDTKARVIQCLACRAKMTTLDGNHVVISSAENNPEELSRIAKTAGIRYFMDVAFLYQSSGMIMSMYITDPDSGSIVWSRSYNSETSRAAAFRRGVDYSQIDDARKETEYVPVVQYRVTPYFLFEPDAPGQAGCLGLGLRMMERYDNRKKEVGFEADYEINATNLVGGASSSTTSLFGGFNLTILFMHAWNLIGDEEDFNHARGSIFAGIGGTYGLGFLGGLVRAGYEWRFGKHYAVSLNAGYRPSATLYSSGVSKGTVGGLEYGLGVSLLF